MPHSALRTPHSAIHRLWPWLAAATTGALLALCFAPWNQPWLCWIGLAPLVCAVWFSRQPARRPGLRAALLGYVSGIVFFSMTFHWLGALGALFETAWLYALSPLLSIYLGLYFAFWAWFVSRLAGAEGAAAFLASRRNLLTGFLGASAWVAHEWVRGWLFSGFGWNGLGVSLHRDLAMMQIVEFTGVLGLSWLVAFCNLMAVIIVRRIAAEFGPVFLKRIRWEFSITVSLVVIVFSFGVRKLLTPEPPAERNLRVAMIQPNIRQTEKWDAAMEDRIFQRLELLTRTAALSQPDLIIWPEAATPRGMFSDETNFQFIRDQTSYGNYSLLLGTVAPDLAMSGETNAAALLTPGAETIQLYRKMHLVPFGEYLPLRPLFEPIAGALVPGDFIRGRDFTLLELPESKVQLAALICFEDTLGELTRRFVQAGAELLINVTNDGWFLETAGAEQHLANAVFRAVENRRTLLRCANTGYTCSIDPNGRVELWSAPFREEARASRAVPIPAVQRITFYTRHGDWIAWVAAAVTGIAVVTLLIPRRQREKKRPW